MPKPVSVHNLESWTDSSLRMEEHTLADLQVKRTLKAVYRGRIILQADNFSVRFKIFTISNKVFLITFPDCDDFFVVESESLRVVMISVATCCKNL